MKNFYLILIKIISQKKIIIKNKRINIKLKGNQNLNIYISKIKRILNNKNNHNLEISFWLNKYNFKYNAQNKRIGIQKAILLQLLLVCAKIKLSLQEFKFKLISNNKKLLAFFNDNNLLINFQQLSMLDDIQNLNLINELSKYTDFSFTFIF